MIFHSKRGDNMTEKPDYKAIWWESMRNKHPGKTDDEIRQIMQSYGKRNDGSKAYLKANPDRASELGALGAKSRWGK